MPKHDQFLWKPKQGDPLKVVDMSDSHVINAVNYFKRKVIEAKSQMPDPEMFEFEYIIGGTEDEFLCQEVPPFKYILLEGKTRGIIQTDMTFGELVQMCKDEMDE